MQHDDREYGDQRASDGSYCGGPFWISVIPKMRVEDLRRVIRVSGAAGRTGRRRVQHEALHGSVRLVRNAGQGRHPPGAAEAVVRGQEPGGLAAHARTVRAIVMRLAITPHAAAYRITSDSPRHV